MSANAHRLEVLVMRVQRVFLETPTLRMTMPQAGRRFGIDNATCEAVLGVLVDAKVLARSQEGTYTRLLPRETQAA